MNAETDEVLVKKHKKITKAVIKKMELAHIAQIPVEQEDVIGKVAASNIVDPETKEVMVPINKEITEDDLAKIQKKRIKQFDVLFIDNLNVSSSLRDTLLIDKAGTKEEALLEIYRKLRPGDPPTYEFAEALVHNMFFSPERYDLSKVGRLKMNHRLGIDVPLDVVTLRKEDIIEVVQPAPASQGLPGRRGRHRPSGQQKGPDRRRASGEPVQDGPREDGEGDQGETDLSRDGNAHAPRPCESETGRNGDQGLLCSSQLSQFMDQTNPLCEITHKRRLSALGPGGLTRERAGFEVRDVHPTHYGRVCPIETPEGPNIGLIASLSTYARVNEYGFIETPYREVLNGRVTNNIKYLSALEEEQYFIAQANAPVDVEGQFLTGLSSPPEKAVGFSGSTPKQ